MNKRIKREQPNMSGGEIKSTPGENKPESQTKEETDKWENNRKATTKEYVRALEEEIRLIKYGGAIPNKYGNRLEFTEGQIEEKRKEMEKELKIKVLAEMFTTEELDILYEATNKTGHAVTASLADIFCLALDKSRENEQKRHEADTDTSED